MNPYTPPNSLGSENYTQNTSTFIKEEDGNIILKACSNKVTQVQIIKIILYSILTLLLIALNLFFAAIGAVVTWREYKKIKDFKEGRLKLSELSYKDKKFTFAFGKKNIEVRG